MGGEINLNGITVLSREDGFIDATALCKAGGKKFNDWYRMESTTEYISFIENYTKINKDNLIEIIKNKHNSLRGTWIHPIIATNVAQWISSEFSFKVSIWIEEWKKNNRELYMKQLHQIIPDKNILKEKKIQLRLHLELGGEIEVKTESGFIDLLTDDEIIEIKHGKNWKNAVGQILMYSLEYPNHKKRIHLFDIQPDTNINNKCSIYNILVTYNEK